MPDATNLGWQNIDAQRHRMLGVEGPTIHIAALARRRQRVVLAATDGPIQLVDLQGGSVRRAGKGSDWAFGALSDEGRIWLHGDRQRVVHVRDWSTRAELSAMSRDPSLAAPAATQPIVPVPPGATPPVPRGSRFVRGTLDASGQLAALSAIIDVELRRTSDGSFVARLTKHREPIQKMLFSPDGTRLVTLAYGLVRGSGEAPILWSTRNGAPVSTLAGSQGIVGLAAFTPDSRRLLTASSAGHLRLWDAVTGALLRESQLDVSGLRGHGVVDLAYGDLCRAGARERSGADRCGRHAGSAVDIPGG